MTTILLHPDRTGTVVRYTGVLAASPAYLRVDERLANRVPPFLTIVMPCGEEYVFQTADDLPAVDLPCRCGDATHWVIEYREQMSRWAEKREHHA
jgi:hypothetical protein